MALARDFGCDRSTLTLLRRVSVGGSPELPGAITWTACIYGVLCIFHTKLGFRTWQGSTHAAVSLLAAREIACGSAFGSSCVPSHGYAGISVRITLV